MTLSKKSYILKKDYALNFVLWSSIAITAVLQTIFNAGSLTYIATLLSIPIFLLSIFNVIVGIITKCTNQSYDLTSSKFRYIYSKLIEHGYSNYNDIERIFEKINDCKKNDFKKIINESWILIKFCDDINSYKKSIDQFRRLRTVRKLFLFIYYLIVVTIFVFMMNYSMLIVFVKDWNVAFITILTTVIISFEIFTKKIVENTIADFVYSKLMKDI